MRHWPRGSRFFRLPHGIRSAWRAPELVAAFVNAALMLAIVGMIAVEGISRLVHPVEVNGAAVAVVAGAGLALNLVVAWMLCRGARDLNMRAALLHVLGDALGSVAALVSGVVVIPTRDCRSR